MAKSSKRTRSTTTLDRFTLLGVIVVFAIVFVAIITIFISQAQSANTTISVSGEKYAQIPQTTTSTGAPVLGDPVAKVMFMEFSDFSCPHCREYESILQPFIDQYVRTKKAQLIYQPLSFFGKQSIDAAQAALCAGMQGHFWEFRDAIFNLQVTEGPQAYEQAHFQTIVTKLGLNWPQLSDCLTKQTTASTLQSATALGDTLGVTGTPTILYSTDGKTFKRLPGADGQPMQGIPVMDDFARVISQVYQQ